MTKLSPDQLRDMLQKIGSIERIEEVRRYMKGQSERPYTIGIRLSEPDEFLNLVDYLGEAGALKLLRAAELELYAQARYDVLEKAGVDLSGLYVAPFEPN